MKQIEIFRTGRHTDINGVLHNFNESDLGDIVASYDPAVHEAPLVVGHPRTDAPAWGWVKSLQAVAGRLIAVPDQVQAAFSEAVASGAYKKVSAAFYLPTDKNNPTPGRWHLRHVGFLGAQPPAIKGLGGVAFAEGDTLDAAVVIEQTHDAAPTDLPTQEQTVSPEEAAALKQQNDQLKRDLEAAQARETAAAQAAQRVAADARETEHAAFAEALVSGAKVPEADVPVIVAMANAIHPVSEPVMFGEGDGATTLYQQFTAFLNRLAPKVAFGEHATHERAGHQPEMTAYAEGTDPEAAELDKKIRAHMAAHNVDYTAAFRALVK